MTDLLRALADEIDPPTDPMREEADEVAKDLKTFVRYAWPVLEPSTPFIDNWHIGFICEHLEQFYAGGTRKLVINIPPRYMKSSLVTILGPVWDWLVRPHHRFVFTSYAAGLSTKHSVDRRTLIESDWHQARFGDRYRLTSDQNVKTEYSNDKRGHMIATSMKGTATGKGGNFVICLAPEVRVETENGWETIGDVVAAGRARRVRAYDHARGERVWTEILRYERSETRPCVRVRTSDGRAIRMTEDHPVFVTGHGYVEAHELRIGDEVMVDDRYVRGLRNDLHASAQGHAAGRALLQPRVPRHRGERAEESSVAWWAGEADLHRLLEAVRDQTRSVGAVTERGPLLLAAMQRDHHEETSDIASVRRVWARHGAEGASADTATLLLPGMFEQGALAPDRRREQPAVCARTGGPATDAPVRARGPEGAGSRSASLSPMRATGGGEARPRRASRGLRQDEQRHDEPGQFVPVVPRQDAREASTTGGVDRVLVVGVDRAEAPEFVYNLATPTHNFFAEGVLVHNCDDPQDPKTARSDAMRETVNSIFDQTFTQRLDDKKRGGICIVMQRLHEKDLTGHVLDKAEEEWTLIKLPNPELRPTTHTFPKSGRVIERQPGDLLWKEREGEDEVAKARVDLGSYGFAGQYGQAPAPSEGGMFKRKDWKFWKPIGIDLPGVTLDLGEAGFHVAEVVQLPEVFEQELQSWDMAFKKKTDTDFVVGQVWGSLGARKFLLDQRRDRMSFTETLDAMRQLTDAWPRAYAKLVEDKANGSAVIDSLKLELVGLIPVEPEGGKEARAFAVSPLIEAGNVFLPHPAIAPWVFDFIEEHAVFPNGANDDQVDGMSQALLRLMRTQRESVTVPQRSVTRRDVGSNRVVS